MQKGEVVVRGWKQRKEGAWKRGKERRSAVRV